MRKHKRWGVFPNPDNCPNCYIPFLRVLTLTPTGGLYDYESRYRPSDADEVWEWKCSTLGCIYQEKYSIGRKKSGKAHTDPKYSQPADTRGLPAGPGE